MSRVAQGRPTLLLERAAKECRRHKAEACAMMQLRYVQQHCGQQASDCQRRSVGTASATPTHSSTASRIRSHRAQTSRKRAAERPESEAPRRTNADVSSAEAARDKGTDDFRASDADNEELMLLGQRVRKFKYGVQLDPKEFEGKKPEEVAEILLQRKMLTNSGKLRPVSSIKPPSTPYFLSFRAERLIESGRYPEAELLVKSAPRGIQNVVVWNILIRSCSKIGRMKHALSLYTEMRSRGIVPNGPTFNHLLVACANSDAPKAVAEAERIYSKIGLSMRDHLDRLGNQVYGKSVPIDDQDTRPLLKSLLATKKRHQVPATETDPQADCVGPTVFHANTLLRACSKHGQIDRMLYFYRELADGHLGNTEYEKDEIAASYPAPPGWYKPPKPDQSTYKIVLSALQKHCQTNPEYAKVMKEIEEEGIAAKLIFRGHHPRTGAGLVMGD